MSEPVTLLFQRKPTQLGGILLDASVREQHGVEIDVTKNPVESGSAISDHRRAQPRQVVVEGIITNTPLPGPNDSTGPQVGPDGRVYQGQSQIDFKRVSDTYRALLDLSKSSDLVTIVTQLEVYENMTMTSLAVPRDTPVEALRFTATFLEIRIVQNATVTVSRTDRGKKKADLHKKPSKPATEQEEEGTFGWYLKQLANGKSPNAKLEALSKFGGGLGALH